MWIIWLSIRHGKFPKQNLQSFKKVLVFKMVSVVTKHCTTPIKIIVLQFPLKDEFRMPVIQDEYEVEISKTVQHFLLYE